MTVELRDAFDEQQLAGALARIVAPQGASIITELHRSPNTPASPKDIWLMTCNHAPGDAVAESTCMDTLATFKFTP